MKLVYEMNEPFLAHRHALFEDGYSGVSVIGYWKANGPWFIRVVEGGELLNGPPKVALRHKCMTERLFERRFNRICDLIRTDGRFWLRR